MTNKRDCTSLGDHLLATTREKKLRGKFVDTFSPLHREMEKKEKDQLDDRKKELLKCRRMDCTSASWLPGFSVCAEVIARANLGEARFFSNTWTLFIKDAVALLESCGFSMM